MVSNEEARLIEIKTRQQSKTKTWFEERQWRLTASRFGEICKATDRRNKETLCDSMYNVSQISTPPIAHGKTYESVALEKFEERLGVKVTPCGLYVSIVMPYLAGSPDGRIFYNRRTYLCEVKCPYTARKEKIKPGKWFPFLENHNGGIRLKRNHNYYYQIIGQMVAAKFQHSFFIVYTFEDLFVEEIPLDQGFFDSNMSAQLTNFYDDHYLPYIVSKL